MFQYKASRYRDMSQRAFDAACKRHGFTPCNFLRYYRIAPGQMASILNFHSRRDGLAYLIRCADKARR